MCAITDIARWKVERSNEHLFTDESSIDAVAEEFPHTDAVLDLLNATLYLAGLQVIPRTTY